MRTGPSCNVRLLLSEARVMGMDRLEAMTLIGHGLGRTRAWLIAHDDAIVNDIGASFCRDLLNRRMLGEPLAYLVESQEFHGLALRVTPSVLIPRPDTETLVDWALEILDTDMRRLQSPRVLDLGTGSGAIALAVKHRCPRAHVSAFDLSADALDIARSNAQELGLSVSFMQSDWWAAADGRCFDLVVSNPPYIAADDRHLPALSHEPVGALVSGHDGLADLERIVVGAPAHLDHDAWLLMEHGYEQGGAVRALFDRPAGSACWQAAVTRRDLSGHERCSGARLGIA